MKTITVEVDGKTYEGLLREISINGVDFDSVADISNGGQFVWLEYWLTQILVELRRIADGSEGS